MKMIAMRKTTLALGASAMLLASCAQNQGGPSQNQVGGAALGALAGAAAGLLVGGDDRRNALVGAGVGLLAGAAVGTYLDQQEQAMNESLAGTGATVTNTGDQLLVSLPAGVTFATDSATIQPQFFGPLDRMSQTLNQYPESFVDVIGHTDSSGPDDYNLRLSQARANSVTDYLASRGVVRQRIVAFGQGEAAPIASNETPEGRLANRRVEIKITPAT